MGIMFKACTDFSEVAFDYKYYQWPLGLFVVNTEKVLMQRQTQNQTKISSSVLPSPACEQNKLPCARTEYAHP